MTRARPTPPFKGERRSEGVAPALHARVSKHDEPKTPVVSKRAEVSDGDEDDFGAPPSRDEMVAVAWRLYSRAERKGDYRSATAAFRTLCELTGALGAARRRKKSTGLAEKLKRATAELSKIPGVR
jgi:hypothetical protein